MSGVDPSPMEHSFAAHTPLDAMRESFKVHTAADPHFFNKENTLNSRQVTGQAAKLDSMFRSATTAGKRPAMSSTVRTAKGAPAPKKIAVGTSTAAAPVPRCANATATRIPKQPSAYGRIPGSSRRVSMRITDLPKNIGSRRTAVAVTSTRKPAAKQTAPAPVQVPLQATATMSPEFMELMENMKGMTGMAQAVQEMRQFMEGQKAHAAAGAAERDARVQSLLVERDRLAAEVTDMQARYKAVQERESAALFEAENMRGLAKTRQAEVERLSVQLVEMQAALRDVQARLDEATRIADARSVELANLHMQLADRDAAIRSMTAKLMEDEAIRRRLHNEVQDLKGNIRVFCRVRPPAQTEPQSSSDPQVFAFDPSDPSKLEACETTTSVTGSKQVIRHAFNYDAVFGPTATQEDVFGELSQFVQSVLDGYSCCVFAYGQTGSGKTYTMEGPSRQQQQAMLLSDIAAGSPERGVIPRAVEQIFASISALQSKGWQYSLEVSFIEVYNEQLRDLLSTAATAKAAPQIKHDQSGKAYVTDCKVVPVTSAEQVYEMLAVARANRAVAATKFNDYSSRSHSVFQLRLAGQNSARRERVSSVLNLVDLAGSERLGGATDSASSKAERQKETQNINLSLHHLRNVITALAAKQAHIPYRASVLTQLLQSSLGGDAKMLMFVNVSPAQCNLSQSLASLRFATTANKCHIGTVQRQAAATN